MYNRDVKHETAFRVTRYSRNGDVLARVWVEGYDQAQKDCQHQVNEAESGERVVMSLVTSVHLFDEVEP